MSESIRNALLRFSRGEPLILLDDFNPDGGGALCVLAEFADPQVINLMIRRAKGIVSVAMTLETAIQVGLKGQSDGLVKRDIRLRRYTISIDADETTTGISAYERSITIKKLAKTRSVDGFKQPGHIFPVIAEPCGLYDKISMVEGAVDLASLIKPDTLCVLCDILDDAGQIAGEAFIRRLAKDLQLPVLGLSQVLREKLVRSFLPSRKRTELLVEGKQFCFFTYLIHGDFYQIGLPAEILKRLPRKPPSWESRPCFRNNVLEWVRGQWKYLTNSDHSLLLLDSATRPPQVRLTAYQAILMDVLKNARVSDAKMDISLPLAMIKYT